VGSPGVAREGRIGTPGAFHDGRIGASSTFRDGRVIRAPAGRSSFTPGRVYSSPRSVGSSIGYRAGSHIVGRPGFNRPIYSGHSGWRPRYWAGGHFRGTYWPRSYFHSGFTWFVPVLPAFYSTFWWGGVPYYYWNDTYYIWSQPDSGYVATDPPPVAESSDVSSSDNAGSADASDSSSLYVYPKNGQSEEQTSNDRYECHQWAAGQTGFDPTKTADQNAASSGPDDYRRAMLACLDARGYSAR
jgi:hypothetical protein